MEAQDRDATRASRLSAILCPIRPIRPVPSSQVVANPRPQKAYFITLTDQLLGQIGNDTLGPP